MNDLSQESLAAYRETFRDFNASRIRTGRDWRLAEREKRRAHPTADPKAIRLALSDVAGRRQPRC